MGDKLSGFHARTAASFVKIAMMCEKQHDVIISLYTQQETWVGGKAISTGSYVRFPTNDLMALMVAELFPGARAFLKFEGEGIVDAVEAMKLFFYQDCLYRKCLYGFR
ncbi:MAG: HPr family phosphocarrier protein [Holophagae bacterium]|nr:HPr family phosphocarrier protein [Holophagae bacterium]